MPNHAKMTAVALVMTIIAAPAYAFRPHIPLDVRAGESPTSYEVFEQRGAGPTHIWCVAADHARRNLDAASAQRIYIFKPLGASQTEPGRQSVGFTLSPAEAGLDQGQAGSGPILSFTSIRQIGASLNLTHALQYCTDHIDVP